MAGLLAYAAAGGLAGIGKGLEDDAEARRQEARDEIRARRAAEEAEKSRRFQSSERVAGQEFRSTETAADRALRIGEADKDRALRQREGETDRAFRERMAEEDRTYRSTETAADRTFRREESEKDRDLRKRPDTLTAKERADLVIAATKAATSEELGTGRTVFDQETYDRMLRAIPGMANAAPASPPAGSPPKGTGTEADPYTATTQSEVDWFKANAKPGQVIVVDGKTYTK